MKVLHLSPRQAELVKLAIAQKMDALEELYDEEKPWREQSVLDNYRTEFELLRAVLNTL